MDWADGYVTDIDYTYGYYQELSPHYARFVLLDAGYAVPSFGSACELGFGQGLSVNIHAASSAVRWWGNDINPAHAAFAQTLAAACGSEARLSDESFAEFCQRGDVPEFDYIGLHGIWSWISDANRAQIVDFVRRHLRVGGVLYLSYNTLPGWSALMPLRQLLAAHAERMSAPGLQREEQVKAALAFAAQLQGCEPRALADERIKQRLQQISGQNPHYLAHEYFNRDWQPMYFADMARALAPAKLAYACQASTLEQVPMLHYSPEQQQQLAAIGDPLFRETVRDYLVNQQFRRDYWLKGARKLGAAEQAAHWAQQRVILQLPLSEVKMKLALPRGTINLSPELYQPVFELLADHRPHRLGELADKLVSERYRQHQLREVIRVLVGSRMLAPLPEQAVGDAKVCSALNAQLLAKARTSGDVVFLASPQSGMGHQVSRFSQLMVLAHLQGVRGAEALAAAVSRMLAANSERMVSEGKMLESEEAQCAALRQQAERFVQHERRILAGLGIIAGD